MLLLPLSRGWSRDVLYRLTESELAYMLVYKMHLYLIFRLHLQGFNVL